ncbi:MAG: Glycolate dehydrogenase (EC, iron-sulfur subunit GlcF [uncultured Thiotrichaceae bacterium]|uniref:Glycolate oxidase iron-sulfur subunit n=1 Tax=uncultured Thiotrichaceae bacterium TaxID=298394 RepID=A0A6S6TQT7_9GAMM|nr:MAG: Glycolate dehydrogenase (EC, iron-sulfur subunit GlcF [uncultured Thiotrichaceae bacterium]
METHLSPEHKDTSDGKLAESILRKCVHCGFCNATCPTYQLLGDENDGPRGRIYLMKQMLEGNDVEEKTLLHLDRCLTCRSCETTCPSGVEYSKLLEVGRKVAEEKIQRPTQQLRLRKILRKTLPNSERFKMLVKSGQLFKPFLPKSLKKKIPERSTPSAWPTSQHTRKMLILDGCVQPAIRPQTNSAAANVLDKLGVSVIKADKAGCCGAVSLHLSAEEEALAAMKRNIDAWWPEIEAGAEAIIMTASGCGVTVKEYAHHLRDDVEYAEKAQRVSDLTKDIAEILLAEEDISSATTPKTLAWHPPCTLQHGQKITGVVEALLTKAGHTLVPVQDQHLCCGSAGTYSILQTDISQQLQVNKLKHLTANKPEMIVTANIGCQTHLQEDADIPVIHWIELFTD